jgi:hypothetical protein
MLPAWIGGIAAFSPSAALVDIVRLALGGTGPDITGPLPLLASWAALFVGVAAWRFRWE